MPKLDKNRKLLLDKVGKGIIKCVYCGCDDGRLLELNHKNGGGTKELGRSDWDRYRRFTSSIMNGIRGTDDLELSCGICNKRHYQESKYGKLPYTIIWTQQELPLVPASTVIVQ